MNPFNLITEPWIPVRWRESSSSKAHLVSINDAFSESSEIADLDCAPHERIALMRLLICITHAALGFPEDAEDWEENEFGKDLSTTVPTYLNQPEIYQHFHLLGDGPRFLQKNTHSKRKLQRTSKLLFHLSAGDSPTFYDHWGNEDRNWTPSQAALALLCLQNFYVGGSMGTGFKGRGPALLMLHTFVLAPTLKARVLSNCLDESALYVAGIEPGRPTWEAVAKETFLSRISPTPCSVWFSDDLQEVLVDQGFEYLKFEAGRDAFATVCAHKNKRYLLSADPNRGIWRDLTAITTISAGQTAGAALNLQCYVTRRNKRDIEIWTGELIKEGGSKAVILDNLESTFTVPLSLFEDTGRALYESGTKFAEEVCDQLEQAVRKHGAVLRSKDGKIRKENKVSTDENVRHFWHTLDQHHGTLINLAADPTATKEAIGSPEATDAWTKLVQQAALDAYQSTCSRSTPRQMQAYAAGIRVLRNKPATKKTTKKAAKNSQTELPLT